MLTKVARRLIGKCYIGQHARTRDYVLLQFKDIVMVGPVIHIPEAAMTQHGLELVLRHLRDGPAPDCTPFSFKDPTTKKEMLKLKREHCLVVVSLLEGAQPEMEMIPMHAGHGFAFDRHADEVCGFPLPVTNSEFMKILGDALEVAT